MAITDHLRLGSARWMTGPAFLRSRAGARWIASLVGATTVLSVLWMHQHDAYPSLTAGSATLHNLLPLGGQQQQPVDVVAATPDMAPSKSPAAAGGLAASSLPPPWIDTPQPFDTSQIDEELVSAALDRPVALGPGLAEAMERFLDRPVLSHEQAVAQNEAACPRKQLDRQVNADQLGGEQKKWAMVDEAQIVSMRRAALKFLEDRAGEEKEEALIGPGFGPDGEAVKRGSRGVVIAAGNHRTVERAIVCVKEIQRLGWKGGVEVWHFEGELEAQKDREALRALGVEIHMVSTKKAPGKWKNFELKAEAVLRSSFDEVLYLDSDNFPLSDISALFEASLFRDPRGGRAVFWPDLNRDHPDNAIHRVLGVPCHDAWELDSGQMLIAKSGNNGLNLAALYLASYMQTEGDYWFSGGDKDTFRYAHLALGIPYVPAPRWLAVLGNRFKRGGTTDMFCGAAMLQYGLVPPRPGFTEASDPTHPEPLFVHANLLKHQSGVRQGNVFTIMRRLSLAQDDVRVQLPELSDGYDEGEEKQGSNDFEGREGRKNGAARPLDGVAGGAKDIPGRGLCSDIWAFGEAADVEEMDAKTVFGGAMGSFEDMYFQAGVRPGAWR